MSERKIINKTMNLDDLTLGGAIAIMGELNNLILQLKSKNLKISSWIGSFDLTGDHNSVEWVNRGYDYKAIKGAVDDINFPWFLYWEIVWVVLNSEFKPGDRILDMGGCSSLFSYYLASKGLDVVAIDLQKYLVDNANLVASEMGWKLRNYVMDMRNIKFSIKFDHIISICVFEHIPLIDRVIINKKIKNLLIEGGKFSLTFDYKNPDKCVKINSPKDVYEQFVKPSGLKIRTNEFFFDNGINYLLHPFYSKRRIFWQYKKYCVISGHFSLLEFFKTKNENDYTFGALFLENK